MKWEYIFAKNKYIVKYNGYSKHVRNRIFVTKWPQLKCLNENFQFKEYF